MGVKNSEIKVALDISAKINKASSQINDLKKQIGNFDLSKSLSGDIAKEFKSIENELLNLQRRAASGEIDLFDAKAAEKEIDKIEKRWNFLLSKIGGESFLEKGLKADTQAMQALASLQALYTKGMKEAAAEEGKLSKKLEEAKQHQKEILETQKQQKVVKASEFSDQKAQVVLAEKAEKAAKKARDDAERALRTKVKESGGKYTMEQASEKGSPLRKTKAYRDFKEKQDAYESAASTSKNEKVKLGSMVTKDMQVAEAQAAEDAINKATEALENYRKTTLETAKEDAFEKAKKSLQELSEFKDIDWSGVGIDFSEIKSVQDLEKALAKLRTEATGKASAAFQTLQNSTKQTSSSFQNLKKEVGAAKENLEDFDEQQKQADAFESRIKQFLGMAGAVEILRRSLRQAFETTKELDSAMTEMAVVTDLDVGDYWNQLPDHTKRANELGVAIEDVYEAEKLYYQQGLKTSQAQSLATTTLRMARIAGLDAADATDKMTAALRGFNMQLNEASAEKVADVYSQLAAITAADVDDISSAMTKTASIASAAGMEFETTAAFLAQIVETTRESAETAGTAMKTVIARFSEVKKLQGQGITSGQDEEGEVIDVNKIQTALRTVGISMDEFFQGTEGLDSIFMQLAEKWDTLDVKTQRYIATTAAGSRQQSRFIAMMSDYKRTQELVAAANDSAGASQKQYEKTLESVEYALTRLKNAWDEFSMGILQSDLVKAGVNILTTFLNIINKATSAFEGLGGTITKVLATVALFKLGQKIFEGIKKPMASFFTKLVSDIYTEGKKAGEAFARGAQDSKKSEPEEFQDKLDAAMSKEPPKTAGQKFNQMIGNTAIAEGKKSLQSMTVEQDANVARWEEISGGAVSAKKGKVKLAQEARAKKVANVTEKENRLMDMASEGIAHDSDEYKQAKKEMEDAQKELVEFDEIQTDVQGRTQAGWEKVGQGVQQLGGAVTALGVGFSMVGGILSQLGLEEAGEGFAIFGNIIMYAGSAISMIGGLIPIVAKVAVAKGIEVQAAWWWLALIVAAVALLVVGIVAIVKAVQNSTIEARMKAAAEATENAKEQAQQVKEAYDDMVADRKGFDEMQDKLKNLTKGTKEWKEALRESNAQVLELISTYPELAKYLGRGEDGQLTISDAGWDQMLESQEKAMKNAQAVVMNKQLAEIDLKEEKAIADRGRKTVDVSTTLTIMEQDVYDGYTSWEQYEEAQGQLIQDLEAYNAMDSDNYAEREKALEEIRTKWGLSEKEALAAAEACEQANIELNAAAEQAESVAQAALTNLASDAVMESEFGTLAIDAFANSMNSEVMDKAVADQTKELKEGSDYRDSEEFDRLAKEYGVESEMNGKNTHDLQTLYKAVLGVEDIPDKIAEDRDAMLEAIAEADQTNQLVKAMEEYTIQLEQIATTNKALAENIASVFSDDGKGISREFANSFMTGEGGTGEFDRSKVDQLARDLGYTDDENDTATEKYAKAMGKTTEELYTEIEGNVRDAIATNESTFKRLNKVVGDSDKKITKFGDTVKLTTEQESKLVDKVINVASISGEGAAEEVKNLLDVALEGAGDSADELAAYLGAFNWQDAVNWDNLEETLKQMNIPWTNAIQEFANKARAAANAIEIVDFSKLNEELKSVYDLLNGIKTGEQNRVFDEDSYNQLITSNKKLVDQFVQLGDKYVYVGSSMGALTQALEKNTTATLNNAKKQLDSKIILAEAADEIGNVAYGGKNLSIEQNYKEWSEEELRHFLSTYSDTALEAIKEKQGDNADLSALGYLDTAGVGLSFGTDFINYGKEALITMMDEVVANYDNLPEMKEEEAKKLRDSTITGFVLQNTAAQNAQAAQLQRSQGNTEMAEWYSTALKAQATQSGLVAESVISQYAQLVEGGVTAEEEAAVQELEETMKNSLEKVIENQAATDAKISLQNRVADAIYNTRQEEIDKLSEVNESINSANDSLLSKIQEQINETRQQRANAEAEENLSQLYSQQAYLAMDTSGSNALGLAELNKQIEDAEQSYQDTLVDQALQELSDANEEAAQQRERQIQITQQQLDYALENGSIMEEAQAITNEALADINAGKMFENTRAAQLITTAEKWQNKPPEEYTSEMSQLYQNAIIAANAAQNLPDADDVKDVVDSVDSIPGEGEENDIASIAKIIQEKRDKEIARNSAVQSIVGGSVAADGTITQGSGIDVTKFSTRNGFAGIKDSQLYKDKEAEYIQNGGTSAQFEQSVRDAIKATGGLKTGSIDGVSVTKKGNLEKVDLKNRPTTGDMKVKLDGQEYTISARYATSANSGQVYGGVKEKMSFLENSEVGSSWIAADNDKLYIYSANVSSWLPISSDDGGFKKAYMKKLNAFKTGGLADFTGPAWLDGTKSKPEIVLDQKDSANFIQLRDILSEIMNSPSGGEPKTNGDNYFDIEINVEKLENDYDVEKIANKIRSMLYEDATYRNVNAINSIR